MCSLPSNEFLDPIFDKEDLIEGFKVMWYVSLWALRSVVGPTFFHKALWDEFGKCILSFMESLIADLSDFLSLLPDFYFCRGDWALEYVSTQFRDFNKISSFARSFDNS